jgi:tRNA(fMet)-specific endonuclease VapC
VICLDTNAVIAVLNGRPEAVRLRLGAALRAGEAIAISSVVLMELWYGAGKSARPKENTERIGAFLAGAVDVLPFDANDAAAAGRLRADLQRTGTPIGPFDVLIAGQALRRGATLVTANMSAFSRVAGLSIADWSNSA